LTKEEYFNRLEESLSNTMNVDKFKNDIKQIFASKIGAEFQSTYSESYVWNRALFLSTNASKLLKRESENSNALKAFKLCGEIYEYLGDISSMYDRQFCKILSALCYDIAGYQANAACLLRSLNQNLNGDFYIVSQSAELNSDLSDENYILKHIQLILLKKIPFASKIEKKSLNPESCEDQLAIELFDSAIYKWYNHILLGVEDSFQHDLYQCYLFYLNKGNAFLSHLLNLLLCRFERYRERSIWDNLTDPDSQSNELWVKYIKLLSHDYYKKFKIKDLVDRNSIFEFWISQLKAVREGVLTNDESFIVQMPTSAGKTFIAEIAILNALVNNPGKKCVYVAPFRALTNEKEAELSHNLSKLGFNISSLSGSYEIDEYQNFILESTDVLIATPEKLDLLLRLDAGYFENVSVLIVDEGHIIGDLNQRASLLEFLVIRLKRNIRSLKILFISAVMPTQNGVSFSNWLSGAEDHIISSPRDIDGVEWQPTRKLIGKFNWIGESSSRITYHTINTQEGSGTEAFVPNLIKVRKIGRRKFPRITKAQTAVDLAYKLSDEGNVLIFCSRPDWAKSVLKGFQYLFDSLDTANVEIKAHFQESEGSLSFYTSRKWFGDDHLITKSLKRRIGIHFGDLPSPLRKAIEQDYKAGIIKILVSTNTIGQGLNFPIKHLIIHSLNINPQQGLKVGVRDFWNIIGRAGRAGKETEGQIIFISLSDSDESTFIEYINKENFEDVISVFALIANMRLDNELNQNEFQSHLRFFSEPFLLSMLVEEIVETSDQDIIEQILGTSLFKFQTLGTELLAQGLRKIIEDIKEQVPEIERIKVFGSNGFRLASNLVMERYIQTNLEDIKTAFDNVDLRAFMKFVLEAIEQEEILEIQFNDKLHELNFNLSALVSVIESWIEGESIDTVFDKWGECVSEEMKNKDKFYTFLSKGLAYKIPWATTTFLMHLSFQLHIDIKDFPEDIRSLSSYIKYGVNSNLGCFAMSLGISNRDLSKLLKNKYRGDNTFLNFVSWLSNLSTSEVTDWDLNQYDRDNIFEVSLRLSSQNYRPEVPFPLEVDIKGTYYFENARLNSLDVEVEDELSLVREYDNEFDLYAIQVVKADKFIGYIPREFAKPLAIEIDLGGQTFSIKVISAERKSDYLQISIHIFKD